MAGVRLVYIDGTQSYLVPHAARTLLNSLAFHKQLFGFTPSEDITVLLLDFEDSGNASATAVPRNCRHGADRAAELRLRNHRRQRPDEHHHEPRAACTWSRWIRRAQAGSILPAAVRRQGGASPGPARIGSLFLPDDAARGGAALVPRRHCDVSSTPGWPVVSDARRAATTRWCSDRWCGTAARFYDPLGLVSEGTKIDFQLQINSYLYGTRFMVWLARTYGPEKVVEWVARRDGSRGYYASQFRHVFGHDDRTRMASLDRRRAFVPAEEPRCRAPVSTHRRPGSHQTSARLGVPRVLRSGGPNRLRRIQLSGHRRARRCTRIRIRVPSSGSRRSKDRRCIPSHHWRATRPAERSSTRPTTAPGVTSPRWIHARGALDCSRRTRGLAISRSHRLMDRSGASDS